MSLPNWNLKLWAVVIALIILLTASGAWLDANDNTNASLSVSIVSRVNNEGSGIFVKQSVIDDVGILYDSTTDTYYADRWDGLVFMTPGPSSIQHMILMDIVKNKLGFSFAQMGTSVIGEVVYWTAVPPGQMVTAITATGSTIAGGIAWEPNYSAAILSGNGLTKVLTTDEVWANHACCVIAASNSYLSSNSDVMYRFLSAYIKGVDWLNEAKSSSSTNHDALIEYAEESTGITDKTILAAALANVEYDYAISNLKSQVETMVNTYSSLGLLTNSMSSLGFSSTAEYANALVKENYISVATKTVGGNSVPREPSDYASLTAATINVAYLQTDIHQLPLHIAIELGYFSDYGITVNLIGPYTAGGDVLNAVISGHADIGLAGSPPTVLTSINSAKVS